MTCLHFPMDVAAWLIAQFGSKVGKRVAFFGMNAGDLGLAIENERGYVPLTVFGKTASAGAAQAEANRLNSALGIVDANQIVRSTWKGAHSRPTFPFQVQTALHSAAH
jgi:hypothetical protein